MAGSCKLTKTQIQKLGSVMSQWHSSMSDPIYAVGSYAYSGKVHPSLATIVLATDRVKTMIPMAKARENGWGPREVRELKSMLTGLRKLADCV